MDNINNHLPKGRLSAQRLSDKMSKISPEYGSLPSSHTVKVGEFWSMMAKTYGATWSSQRGRMTGDDGYATEDFIEWSLGTAHLTDENWAYGFERIVQKMRADIAHNRDPFPPGTPAIFCAMCFPPEEDPRYAVKAAGAASLSYKRHPNLTARDEQSKRIALSPDYQDKKSEARNKTMANILEGL